VICLAGFLVAGTAGAAPLEIVDEDQSRFAFAPEGFRGFTAGTAIVGSPFIAIMLGAEATRDKGNSPAHGLGNRSVYCYAEPKTSVSLWKPHSRTT
jgi:hypothetical protein